MRVAQLRYRPPCGVGLVFADDMEALRAGVLAPYNHRRAKLNTGSYPYGVQPPLRSPVARSGLSAFHHITASWARGGFAANFAARR